MTWLWYVKLFTAAAVGLPIHYVRRAIKVL